MSVLLSVLTLLLAIGALVDIIIKPDEKVKHLPKLVWVLLVAFLPLIGSVVWFVIGREYSPRPVQWQTRPSVTSQSLPIPRSTEEQIADLDQEIEYYQKRAQVKALQEGARPLAIEAGVEPEAASDAAAPEPMAEPRAADPAV